MKNTLFIICFCFFSFTAFAQHCPFDGGSAIVISIKNKKLLDSNYSFLLVEINNPLADSCKYAEGLLKIPFGTIDASLVKKYDGSWTMWAKERIKDCTFNQPENRAVVLNQAQKDYMVSINNDFNYHPRQFEIHLFHQNKLMKKMRVPDQYIYSVCTGNGPWTRIQPIEISFP